MLHTTIVVASTLSPHTHSMQPITHRSLHGVHKQSYVIKMVRHDTSQLFPTRFSPIAPCTHPNHPTAAVSSSDDAVTEDDLLIERLLEANNYLRAENTALRNTLGIIQGCAPEEVEFDFDYDTELENLVEATTFAPAPMPAAPPAPGRGGEERVGCGVCGSQQRWLRMCTYPYSSDVSLCTSSLCTTTCTHAPPPHHHHHHHYYHHYYHHHHHHHTTRVGTPPQQWQPRGQALCWDTLAKPTGGHLLGAASTHTKAPGGWHGKPPCDQGWYPLACGAHDGRDGTPCQGVCVFWGGCFGCAALCCSMHTTAVTVTTTPMSQSHPNPPPHITHTHTHLPPHNTNRWVV